MLAFGQPGSGKTHLLYRMTEETFNPSRDRKGVVFARVQTTPLRSRLGFTSRFLALQQNLWVDRGKLGLCPKPQGFLRHGSGVPRVDEEAPLRVLSGGLSKDTVPSHVAASYRSSRVNKLPRR